MNKINKFNMEGCLSGCKFEFVADSELLQFLTSPEGEKYDRLQAFMYIANNISLFACRNQVYFDSTSKLAKIWRWSRSATTDFINDLESRKFLRIQRHTNYGMSFQFDETKIIPGSLANWAFSNKSQNAVSSSSFESCDKEELIQIISSISNSLDILGKKIIGENKIPGICSTPIISRPFDANASNGDSPSQKNKLASDAK